MWWLRPRSEYTYFKFQGEGKSQCTSSTHANLHSNRSRWASQVGMTGGFDSCRKDATQLPWLSQQHLLCLPQWLTLWWTVLNTHKMGNLLIKILTLCPKQRTSGYFQNECRWIDQSAPGWILRTAPRETVRCFHSRSWAQSHVPCSTRRLLLCSIKERNTNTCFPTFEGSISSRKLGLLLQ